MASSRWSQPLAMLAVLGCGFAAMLALRHELYASMLVALLVGASLVASSPRRRPRILLRDPIPRARDDERVQARVMLDQVPTPLVGIDRGGRAHALNRAARLLFSTDDLVGLPAAAQLATSPPRGLRNDGRNWRIEAADMPGAGATRAILVLTDVEAAERAAEARATRDLLQVLSHEVMNALAPITSLADSARAAALQDPPETAALRDMLGTLSRRAEGLQRFTEAYRELARLPPPVLDPTSLDELADDLSRLFVGRWGGRVALAIERAGGAATIDRDQLSQALWALLQNAAEAALAADAPGVTLAFRSGPDTLTIAISDTGPGIPPDTASRMFDVFFTTKPHGSGVGLSLARQIARGHGGDLALRPGVSTSFVLSLPNRG